LEQLCSYIHKGCPAIVARGELLQRGEGRPHAVGREETEEHLRKRQMRGSPTSAHLKEKGFLMENN
jgi:hypothetical protein